MKEPWPKVWEVTVGAQASYPVRYSAYPEPSFKWYVHVAVAVCHQLCVINSSFITHEKAAHCTFLYHYSV